MREKKYFIILVLKILENETDGGHPLTQGKIAQIISDVYPCDRKTVGRNIAFLKKIGYPIVKTPKGFYMSQKRFTNEEKDFILDAIRNASGKTDAEKDDIIFRLSDLLVKLKR